MLVVAALAIGDAGVFAAITLTCRRTRYVAGFAEALAERGRLCAVLVVIRRLA
jgi:hypothetical protein